MQFTSMQTPQTSLIMDRNKKIPYYRKLTLHEIKGLEINAT